MAFESCCSRIAMTRPRIKICGVKDEAVARAAPEWTLQFIGPVRHLPERVAALPNVEILPGVPYEQLPSAIASS